jgi:hypothetical protein
MKVGRTIGSKLLNSLLKDRKVEICNIANYPHSEWAPSYPIYKTYKYNDQTHHHLEGEMGGNVNICVCAVLSRR